MILIISTLFILMQINLVLGNSCVECHQKISPNIVSDWQLSKHFQNEVRCESCHGDAHITDKDFAYAELPTAEVCGTCHDTQKTQFSN